ncbi:DUF4376 domain-containing protein [Bosea sp. TWI1241]|uniref:DUF4376 domain-containing protein n=1 Tax=Bosea sp. TWI1241 TaxID=3148904 RepID=UPI00320B82BF
MLVAFILDGVVQSVSEIGDKVIDPDGRAARGPATYLVKGPAGEQTVAYEAVFKAPAGCILVASDEAAPGWSWDGESFSPPPPVPATKAELAAYARDLRWQVEIGGIEAGGVQIATDDRSKTMILGARLAAQADPSWSTIWQDAAGQAHPVDAAAIVAISDAVQAHVNGTFVTLADVLAAIDTGTMTTAAEIDGAFAA